MMHTQKTNPTNPIIVAIDHVNLQESLQLITELKPFIGAVKLGLEFFIANGKKGVATINQLNIPIFLDLKLHDIPNTVYHAIYQLTAQNIFMTTVHLSGGKNMLKKANEAALKASKEFKVTKPLIIGVSALTSLTESDLQEIGVKNNIQTYVLTLAKLAYQEGLDGIVCSPHELDLIKSNFPQLKTIVPGIRDNNLFQVTQDDQIRILTPKLALEKNADFLVIGRLITASENPKETAKAIYHSIID